MENTLKVVRTESNATPSAEQLEAEKTKAKRETALRAADGKGYTAGVARLRERELTLAEKRAEMRGRQRGQRETRAAINAAVDAELRTLGLLAPVKPRKVK